MKQRLITGLSLSQTLTPQQIQYLKLLQMPLQQLEQKISAELEENPFLEISDYEISPTPSDDFNLGFAENPTEIETDFAETGIQEQDLQHQIAETKDPFEYYRRIWEEDEIISRKQKTDYFEDEEEWEPFQIKATRTFHEDLTEQLRMLSLPEEDLLLGEQILGNIEDDGYLRCELSEIVEDTNAMIAELNIERQKSRIASQDNHSNNPAAAFAISEEAKNQVERVLGNDTNDKDSLQFLKPVTLEDAERVLKIVQNLDPPGVASRNLQECLIAQTNAFPYETEGRNAAYRILTEGYDLFSKKHFNNLLKQLEMTEEELRSAIEFIKKLNPKPGYSDSPTEFNTVIPDFIVEKDPDTAELLVILNESTVPTLRINKVYEQMRKDAKLKKEDKETKEWIKNKYDNAKFLIQALSQRRATMLKVMTAIVGRQKDFFNYGPSKLKPLIYKDISEDTGLDIATVCRIVNNKFVQTQFGTFELKYFFSESLPSENGEEVSTKVIKQVIKEIINNEQKDKPYSDEKIVEELKKLGYIVARRTVAKYREQMRIPVARLRKEL